MSFDGYPGTEGSGYILSDVGPDRVEDGWRRIVGDNDLQDMIRLWRAPMI